MPKIDKPPDGVRPYLFHGLDLDWVQKEHAVADCPWCGREGKFTVTVETGTHGCFICGEKGNFYTFMRKLWDESDKKTNGQSTVFAQERGLLDPMTLTHWGVVVSILDGSWIIPGWSPERKLTQLYKRIKVGDKDGHDRWELRPTPTLPHAVYGLNLWDPKKKVVHLHESWGNALAWWEVLRSTKKTADGELALTGNPEASLAAHINVISVANCGAVGDPLVKFLPLLVGKDVITFFDSDKPREHNGTSVDGAGFAATQRVSRMLLNAGVEAAASSVHWLKWGERGFDSNLPSGFDVRDALTTAEDMPGRIAVLADVLDQIEPIPEDWVKGRTADAASRGGGDIQCLPCRSWAELVAAWRKAMKWIEGLDRGLSCSLAAILSTGSVGSQVWLKLIGPPSSGKSTLCEAMTVNPRHVKALSTIRGFHSGYKEGDGSDNKSLILKLKNKTLITKDGDSLLTAPNKEQILGEARDLFDKTARSDYRTGMGMDHSGVNMTWILCGTKSLRSLDQSELGARFVDVVIMEDIDDELEDEINTRAAYRAIRNVKTRSNCDPSSGQDPDLLHAMQLTGGYIDYLHDNAEELLNAVEIHDSQTRRVVAMGKFVAFMRARPSLAKDAESEDRELSPRLVEQFIRLSLCLAAVLSKKDVDEEVMRVVRQTAMDTARGRTLEIARQLYTAGERGVSVYALAVSTGQTETKEREMLRFLRRIGAVERFDRAADEDNPGSAPGPGGAAAAGSVAAKLSGVNKRTYWRLTTKMANLYREVVGDV